MKLHEEFKLYENMWDDKCSAKGSKRLTEQATVNDPYSAMMEVQKYIQSTLGWDIIDCQQDDEDSMMLYCDGTWDDDAIKALEDFAADNGVEISIIDSRKSSYNYRVYLNPVLEESKTKQSKRPLTEARSVADIEADIAKLQAELADAKVAEKKASYGGNIPTDVWYWDIYFDPSEKGTWTSIDNDIVFETEDAAFDGAYEHLRELEDEGELEYDSDDYYVDAVKIPLSKVSADVLEWSGLNHLI
jgi:hypothetical protein